MQKVNDYGLTFWIHLLIILLIYISWFLFSWKIILFFVILYYIQLLIFGNCILTKHQFGDTKRNKTFYWYYLKKLGFDVDVKKVRLVVDYIIPPFILLLALLYQVVLGYAPVVL